MNSRNIIACYIICNTLTLTISLAAPTSEQHNEVQAVLDKKLSDKKHTKKQTIAMNFDSADLVDVINLIAAEKDVNIVLPMGAQAINAKVTLSMDHPVPIQEAWKLLYTLLDIAGYSLVQKHDSYAVVKLSPTITREPAPIFIGVDPANLPNYDKRITYLYYLAHLKVPRAGEESKSEVDGILKEALPATALIKYEPSTNAVIINDEASNIRNVMMVVKELDKPGFQETFDIVKLRYAQADLVTDLFNKSIIAAANPAARLSVRKPSEAQYFPQGTRIFSEPRTNSLFILGSAQAIERIKDFIIKYIDVELGSGKSILHTYQLQYLDAEPFAAVLANIIQSSTPGGTQQSKASPGTSSGSERFFEDVIITTDKPVRKGSGTVNEYSGGNKLIIAARNDDWERIKKLIEQLDTPQPQVIIEVLIADLSLNDDRILGSIMRNPAVIPLPTIGDSPQSVNFQSAQIGQVATNANTANPSASTIAADLAKFNNGTTAIDIPKAVSAANPGSTIITMSDPDGSTWNILQILQGYGQTKILSNPHVITTNNKRASVDIGEIRLVPAEAVGSAGGATTARNTEIKASLTVSLTPRISSAKTVNVTIEININEFISTNQSDGNRNTRTVKTNANIESNGILALGGLIKVTAVGGLTETPVLGRIPILGWFFKNRNVTNVKNNLTVFLRPTIIEPRLRGGIGTYTSDYIGVARSYAQEGMVFDTLRDPITRWFFKSGVDADEALNMFLAQNVEPEKAFDTEKIVVADTKTKHRKKPIKKVVKNKSVTPAPVEVAQQQPAQPENRGQQIKNLVAHEENPLLATKDHASKPVLNT